MKFVKLIRENPICKLVSRIGQAILRKINFQLHSSLILTKKKEECTVLTAKRDDGHSTTRNSSFYKLICCIKTIKLQQTTLVSLCHISTSYFTLSITH